MSETARQLETPESQTRVPGRKARRSHRLARWLGTIVALLIIVVILGVLGTHQIDRTNQALSHISTQLSQAQASGAQFHSAVLRSLNGIQATLNQVLERLNALIQTVSHTH